MVVISSTAHPQADAGGGVQLPTGVVMPIYAVPTGRWLVITHFGTPSAQLLRVVAGVATVVVDTELSHFNPTTGIAFPPGSTVALRSTSAQTSSYSQYHFTGYLAPGGASPACDWPPSPESMVVLNSREVVGSVLGYLPVPGNSTIAIYAVPLDKWLVLTDPDVRGSVQLVQLNGPATVPMMRGWQYTVGHPTAVGLAFPPGSQVGIQNKNATPENFCHYLMTGYLKAK
jgi:hypothetical protein